MTLSALPGGILFPQKINILATGYLLNLSATVAEINHLKKRGFFKGELLISNRAHLIMPYHLQLDYCQEEQKSLQAIGTTKKGIGPCMQDKMGRIGLRFGDLVDSNFFASRLTQVVNQKNQQLSILTKKNKTYAFQTLFQETMTLYQKIAHFGCNLLHW